MSMLFIVILQAARIIDRKSYNSRFKKHLYCDTKKHSTCGTGCLMIYWLRFTRAFRLEVGIRTELSTENPEAFQESIFNAK